MRWGSDQVVNVLHSTECLSLVGCGEGARETRCSGSLDHGARLGLSIVDHLVVLVI